ncbi:MAG: hypothetical protein ACOX2F_08740 [bacterium]
MRNILILLVLTLFLACNSDKSKNDADTNDNGLAVTDVDTFAPDNSTDLPDEASTDLDGKPDVDDDKEETVPCLDLRYNENTIKTNFPFKDKDGKPTFCRPGCDTPTETDPQCVRNIWEWDNWEKYQKYLKAQKSNPTQTTIRECYPWPCVLPGMKAISIENYTSKCDRMLTTNGFRASMGAVWTHGMSDGVAGMLMSRGAIEYDSEKDEFIKIGQAAAMLSYNKGKYVFPVYDRSFNTDDYRSFIISAEKKNGKYYYELIYNNAVNNSFMSNPSFVGKDWVLIQVRSGKESSDTDVKYAKAGEWEWHSLGLGKVFEGNIVGNHLTFMVPYTNPDRQIYYCNLSKYPKSYKECYKATGTLESGEAEMGHSPRIDEDNENRLIYSIYNAPTGKIKEIVFKDGVPSKTKEYALNVTRQPTKVKGNLMSFTSSSQTSSALIGCFYRFDKEKMYCPAKPWSKVGTEIMEFNTFDRKWHLWSSAPLAHIRDWECYCKEEGICPFEE